jgi:hypothetical protein
MEQPADTLGCSTGRPAWVLRLAAVEAADTVPLLLLLLLRKLLLLSIPHHLDGLLLLVLPLLLLPLLLLPGLVPHVCLQHMSPEVVYNAPRAYPMSLIPM